MNRIVLLMVLIALLGAGVAAFEVSKKSQKPAEQAGLGTPGPGAGAPSTAGRAVPAPEAFKSFTTAWRKDPVWYDGQAEIAMYEATRTIYGKERKHVAKFMTNKERYSTATLTKSAGNDGPEVFKHHVREDIPTEKYNYHFSTMTYTHVDDLSSLKLDMGSQEDCGASMKLFIQGEGHVKAWQYSYFPDMGIQQKQYDSPASFALANGLTLILRGYPFETPLAPTKIDLVPDQRGTKLTELSAKPATLTFIGKETLQLPAGPTEAYHLRVSFDDPKKPDTMDFWFHAQAEAPHLNILVQYTGPDGITYKLKSQVRDAYWVR